MDFARGLLDRVCRHGPEPVPGDAADASIRFAIKPVGDFTRRLRDRLKQGDRIQIEGGHGRFNFERGGDTQL
ncbi:hypothetical protein [Breoghania sp. L-A4]|uniref:hypothetical protein n=1 Tax=Breoghania sp. L-A4 TaxID=2304600 RepID=UPI000E35E499|nr:hypothetical protein [Breoghania sp. L-A4]AXS41573.1 hypothetical protein D1F64_18145 [Breoghania sp. L-A4]